VERREDIPKIISQNILIKNGFYFRFLVLQLLTKNKKEMALASFCCWEFVQRNCFIYSQKNLS